MGNKNNRSSITHSYFKAYYYRPQRSWGKVMFLHVSVILFIGGSASVHAGIPPPPTTAGTPSGAGTPLGAGTTQEQMPPKEQSPREQTPQEQVPPPCAVHAGRYRQQAGGKHPTGMQSCCLKVHNTCTLEVDIVNLGINYS